MSPVSVVTRTTVASKCTRGFVSQLALKGGASGRRWWLIATAAILCPTAADRGLKGRALIGEWSLPQLARHSKPRNSLAASKKGIGARHPGLGAGGGSGRVWRSVF